MKRTHPFVAAALFAAVALFPGRAARAVPESAAPPTPLGKSCRVPYRLTDTRHFLIRAKINGAGPYNFIMDTGAPALFVPPAIAKKLGVTASADGWGTFNRLEIEGGAALEKVQGRVEEPFQITSMNAIGLAGVHLDGILGYNVLSQFKIDLDLRTSAMTWTRVDHDATFPTMVLNPSGAPQPDSKAAGNVAALEALAKMATALMPKQDAAATPLRGYFGLEIAEKNGPVVKSILAKSPAAAGLKPGDRITSVARGTQPAVKVATAAEAIRALSEVPAGETVKLTVERGKQTLTVAVAAANGCF